MESEFSEFSFGYAATKQAERDLAQGFQARGAPVFPSLLEEFDLGWDVGLEFAEALVFFQFKRVEWVSRRHPTSPTWDNVGHAHTRFSIDTSGHQHRALTNLDGELRMTGMGYLWYVAPQFHTVNQFDRAYASRSTLTSSTFLLPSDLPVGDGVHHVTHSPRSGVLIHSEPRKPERNAGWEENIGSVTSTPLRNARRDDHDAERIAEALERATATARSERPKWGREAETVSERISSASVALGLSAIVMRSRPSNYAGS